MGHMRKELGFGMVRHISIILRPGKLLIYLLYLL